MNPERTWALIVAIDKYDGRPGFALDGCVTGGLNFLNWLRSHHVPEEHITLCVSPRGVSPLDKSDLRIESAPTATWENFKNILPEIKGRDDDVLWVCWGGHGVLDTRTSPFPRKLLLQDSPALERGAITVHFLADYFRTNADIKFKKQFFFIDACATEDQEYKEWDLPWTKTLDLDREQYIFFASKEGRLAKGDSKGGHFTNTVIDLLKRRAQPPQLDKLADALWSELNSNGEYDHLFYKNKQGTIDIGGRDRPLLECDLVEEYLTAIVRRFEEESEDECRKIVSLTTKPGNVVPHPTRLLKFERKRKKSGIARPDDWLIASGPDHDQTSVDLIEYLSTHGRFLLLGPPGAGKSTLLRNLLHRFGDLYRNRADQGSEISKLPRGWQGRIPILVSLKLWRDENEDLLSFLRSQIPVKPLQEKLELLMREGRVVLLLDGLNELPPIVPKQNKGGSESPYQDERIVNITNLAIKSDLEQVGCIITAQDTYPSALDWRQLFVLDLNPNEVKVFVDFYSGADPDRKIIADEFKSKFGGKVDLSEMFRPLIERPFYLINMLNYCQHVKKPNSKESPLSRVGLLEDTIEAAFDTAISNDRLTEKQAEELKKRLSLLAFNMTDAEHVDGVDRVQATKWLFNLRHEEPSYYLDESIEEPTVEEMGHALDIWRWAQWTGLVSVTRKEILFRHELFQSYFCLCYCSDEEFRLYDMLGRITFPAFQYIWPLWAERDSHLSEKLIELLSDDVRGDDAGFALAMIGDQHTARLDFETFLLHNNDRVRQRARQLLASLGARAVSAAVASLATTAKTAMEMQKIRVYAIEAIAELVDTKEPERHKALEVLGAIESTDLNHLVQRKARKAIRQIEQKRDKRRPQRLIDRMLQQRNSAPSKEQTSDK